MNRWIRKISMACVGGIIVVLVLFGVWSKTGLMDTDRYMDQTHMTERIDKKTFACNQLEKNEQESFIKQKNTKTKSGLVYSEEYNISYCKVGKAGGTFIKHMFSILVNGVNSSAKLENMSRLEVHKNVALDLRRNSFDLNKMRSARLITVGRNPYSRLYSAYIDRISVPALSPPIREGSKCSFDVTFKEFLRIVVQNTAQGKIDMHWSPIYYVCKPCDVKSTFIVKQETFSDDIQFVVKKLRLPDDKRNDIIRKLTDSRITWTITGIVKAQMMVANRLLRPGCIGWLGVIKRIWRAFQVQGYIDEDIDLTLELYNETNDFSNEDLFLQTVFKTIDKHPMSSEAMLKQRQKALVHAYKDVDKEIIEDIKRVYKPDFDMFGYSDEPPI